MRIARSLRAVTFVYWVVFACGCGTESRIDGPQVQGIAQGLTAADCPAGYNLIQGTNAAETLTGTAGNDCIIGLGGNDTISGGGGNDYIAGGNGDDTINGEAGNDQLFGEGGADNISGGDGNDTIDGGAVGDTINCGAGDDTVVGSAGDDIINGDAGRDTLNGGDAVDTIHGGTGDDVIHGDGGNDELYGDDDDDVIDGDANADSLFGGNGDDVLYGDLANDDLHGDAGDDALIGGAGTNTSDGGAGTDSCTGTSCEKPVMTLSGCTQNAQCSSGQHCIADFGLCLGCVSNQDNDALCDSKDGCPTDASKTLPGACGCGVSDADGDGDGTANCNDGCPSDASKVAPGVCGCGVSDADSDGDGTKNCNDGCPNDASKVAPGVCGCGVSDADSDGDGTKNCNDGCPNDASKVAPGVCGCGVSDTDSDNDGTANCHDGCVSDATKTAPGVCGCGVSDADSDSDGTANCHDGCPSDVAKTAAGVCGCGVSDTDSDNDGTANCNDGCPNDAAKTAAGTCGCGVSDTDSDNDGTANCNDACPNDAAKTAAGACGCGVSDADSDGDGVANCNDVCPGHSDGDDSDGDGIPTGCDSEVTCTPSSAGSAVRNGNVTIDGPEDIAGLGGIQCITGDLSVEAGPLTNLEGLEGLVAIAGSLYVSQTNLESVDGLDGLASVGGDFVITQNEQLVSLAGLEQLAFIGGTVQSVIWGNTPMPGCWVWEIERNTARHLDGNGQRGKSSCGELPQGFQCVPGAVGPGVLDGDQVLGHDLGRHELGEIGGVTCITGDVSVQPFADFVGVDAALSHLVAIGGHLTIDATPQTNLSMLQNLREIGTGLTITDNVALVSLSGLSSLSELGAHADPGALLLSVQGNPCLPETDIEDLEQRTSAQCGAGGTAADACEGNADAEVCSEIGCSAPNAPDSDGDGISDACDACAFDVDSDLDGVCDMVDVCPGADDHADADQDGVCDAEDLCTGDDLADADGDGICDAEDLCMGVADFRDANQDGVSDHCELLRPIAVLGGYVTGSAIVDIDADGDKDIVSLYPNSFINHGNFDFEALSYVPGSRNNDLGTLDVDFDGDGILDGLCDGPSGFQYSLCYGTAPGLIIEHTLLTTSPPSGVATGDVNSDGTPDLVFFDGANSSLKIIEVLPGPQRGVARVQQVAGAYYPSAGPFIRDLDGDGSPELYLQSYPGTLQVFERDASGDYHLTGSAPGVGRTMAIGDVDGDGLADIVMGDDDYVNNYSGTVQGLYVHRGLPETAVENPGALHGQHVLFDAPQHVMLPTPAMWPTALKIAHLGGGSSEQILLASGNGLYVLSYDRAAQGLKVVQFVPNAYNQNAYSRAGLSVGDLDGNGSPDVVSGRGESFGVLKNVACKAGDPDADADGIPDACDPCAGPNADADEDEVCDAADHCASGDDHLDADHDGTADACDACPNDAHGDSDGDGSCDSVDPCPFGDDSRDTDGDGLCDAIDVCPLVADTGTDPYEPGLAENCNELLAGAPFAISTGWSNVPASGDLDHDGRADLVLAAGGDRSQWLSRGDGAYDLAQDVAFSEYTPRTPARLVDLDGDGNLDAVVQDGTGYPTKVVVAYGDGAGQLEAGQTLNDTANDFAVADVTGDGVLDIVIAGTADAILYTGAPGRGAYTRSVLASDVALTRVVVGNFNGDGVRHIIGASGQRVFHAVRKAGGVFANDWLVPSNPYNVQQTARTELAVGDVDLDGRDDLVIAAVDTYYGSSSAMVYNTIDPRTWDGRVWQESLVGRGLALVTDGGPSFWQTTPDNLQMANVMGDPRPEVLIRAGSNLVIYGHRRLDNGSDGGLYQSIPMPALQFGSFESFTASDVDGDGDNDIAALVGNNIVVLWNGRCPNGPAADTDNDGWPDACDICVGPNADADGDRVCDAQDVCAAGDDGADADHDQIPDACDVCPNDPDDDVDHDGACGDVDACPHGTNGLDGDGDGVCDAEDVCPGTNDNLDADFNGEPDGCAIFTQGPTSSTAPDGVFRFDVGDVDGDGWTDVVTSANDTSPLARLWLNDGAGALVAQTVAGWETTAGIAAVLHDMDGDGNVDAVLGLAEGGAVFYGDGSGAFPTSESFSDTANDIQVADVTGDGTADVVLYANTPYGGTGGVVVWVGAEPPARGFVDRIEVRAPDELAQGSGLLVRTGDLDGDGTAEIVVRTEVNALLVYRQSAGGFAAEQLLPLPGGTTMVQDLAFGHHNGDARADLLMLRYDASYQTWVTAFDSVAAGSTLGPLDMDSAHFALKWVGNGYASGAQRVLLANVTGSSNDEIVIAGASQLVIGRFDAGYELHALQRISGLGYTSDLRAADLEQDGDTDLFYARFIDPVTETFDPLLGILLNQSP